MHRFLFKRLVFFLITVLAASAFVFFMMHAIPGGAAETVLKHAFLGLEESGTEEQVLEISSRYNLMDPLWRQYLDWLRNAVTRFDLGISYIYQKPVVRLLLLALPATVILAATSMALAIAAGIPLGIYSALKENTCADNIIRAASITSISLPGFWMALLLILIFSITLKWFPVSGYGTPAQLVLPALTLAIYPAAVVVRIMRTSMLETMAEPYITFAVAKGLSFRRIVYAHAFKNAVIPVLTVLGIYFGHLLAGTVIIETIFAWPGIGSLLVDSIYARDIPVVTGCIVVIVCMFLLVNLCVDLLYRVIDPRISYE